MMNYEELIRSKRSELLSALKSADKNAYSNTHLQYSVYLWDDGTITTLEDTAGGYCEYAAARDGKCLEIATFCHQFWVLTDGLGSDYALDKLLTHATEKELSDYVAWLADAEEPEFCDKFDFWQQNTEAWWKVEEEIIDNIVSNTDYSVYLD